MPEWPTATRVIHGEGGTRDRTRTGGRGPSSAITASEDDAPAGERGPDRVVAVPLAYVSAVERGGGVALVLPAQSTGTEALAAILDGLVLSGGPDVAPDHYGELVAPPHPAPARRPRRLRTRPRAAGGRGRPAAPRRSAAASRC